MTKDGAEMELTTAQEIILKLKAVKEKQALSIPQIKQMVDSTGAYLSMTTLRRVFADGSEQDSFSYENTIRPIAQALLVNNEMADDPAAREKIDGLLAVIHHKGELIESLHKQIDNLKEEQEKRCKMCEEKTEMMKKQIDLKDKRMDEQAKRIDKLMDKLLEKI